MRPRAEAGRDKAPLFIPYDPASKSVRGRLKSQVSAHVARRAWRHGRPAAQSSSQSETSEEEVVESPTHMVRRDGSQVILQPILKKLPIDTPDSLFKYCKATPSSLSRATTNAHLQYTMNTCQIFYLGWTRKAG